MIFLDFQFLSFLLNSLNTFLIAVLKLPLAPAHLEEKIPGFLFKTLISKPESSAKQIIFVFFEKNLALIKEFSLNDFPFSFGLLSFRSFSE
ncbi:uncharacterized protein METZ01_LOCUS292683 [marine metagenome]|uniref:Uncharacterized protein n=1 Tax=marine metagenome TaxID=408172 RepID=A0A382LSY5_9ZZZZ